MNIESWINKNKTKLKNEGYISVHLDDLGVEDNYLKNSTSILNNALITLKNKNVDLQYIKIELQFELIGTNTNIKGVPCSLKSLESRVSNISPELIISKRQKGYVDYLPKIEYYMSPLPFFDNMFNSSLNYCYTEYRTIDDLLEKEIYTSWLNIVWVDN